MIRYNYADGIGGTLAVGLNGSPFNPDYAIMRWTGKFSLIKELS